MAEGNKRPSKCTALRVILGDNRFSSYTRTRVASRAVILRDDSILLVHEANEDQWMIPGGGMEEGETGEACCIREAEEETGLLVGIVKEFLTIEEYYEEYRYTSRYYICEVTGTGTMRLTEAETEAGLKPEWIPLRKAMEIFSHHQDFALFKEERRGMYLREYIALKEYLKQTVHISSLKLAEIQPSQFKVSEEKLRHVQDWFHPDDLSGFGPIPVAFLDGNLVMTDGHTRAVAALLAGLEKVPLVWDDDELDWEMYRRCVSECINRGIDTPEALIEQIVSGKDYKEQWDKWCDQMQEEVKRERSQRQGMHLLA